MASTFTGQPRASNVPAKSKSSGLFQGELKTYVKVLRKPDEVRPFANGKLELVHCGDIDVGLGTFQPGWKWSNDVKPIALTKSCEAPHIGYCLKGRMHIRMDDGKELEVKAGDAFTISPGHDAWVVGNEPCEMLDVSGFKNYAKPN